MITTILCIINHVPFLVMSHVFDFMAGPPSIVKLEGVSLERMTIMVQIIIMWPHDRVPNIPFTGACKRGGIRTLLPTHSYNWHSLFQLPFT